MRRLGGFAIWLVLWLGFSGPALAASSFTDSPFADWAAIVVAGDWHAHSGGPSEAFDNARRDVAQALRTAGFEAQNVREFSVRPRRYRPTPAHADADGIYDSLLALTSKAQGGCLIYFSSHGAPSGVVVDDRLLSPDVLSAMLDDTCGQRPTVVVISACFSGVFVPALAAPNRLVLTAARADRSSFGCGEADRYPYFDDCFLSSFDAAGDFGQLGRLIQACVARREKETGMAPPSEPQLSVGPGLRPLLPLYALPGAHRAAAQF